MSLVKEKYISEDLDRDINAINTFIKNVSQKHILSFKELVSLLGDEEKDQSAIKIPCSIFRERLGILESVAKYMKEFIRPKIFP